MGNVKHDQIFRLDVRLGLSRAELVFGSTLIMLEILCWNTFENNEQITKSGWAGIHLIWVLPTKVKVNV